MEVEGLRVPDEQFAQKSVADQHDYWQDVKKRITRRNLIRYAGAGLATSVASPWLFQRAASAVTTNLSFGRHLAYGADPMTQMRVAWQVTSSTTSSALPVANPILRLGTSASSLTQSYAAELRHLDSTYGTPNPNHQFYLHAALDGLAPGTTYYYWVGHDGVNPTDSGAKIKSFTTAPAAGSKTPFSFTAVGDQGVGSSASTLTSAIKSSGTAFQLIMGDITYAEAQGYGVSTDTFNSGAWDTYFTTVDNNGPSVPWMVSTGNHDMESWYSPHGYGGHQQRMDFPPNGATGCPTTYSFRYANCAFLSLDGNDVCYEYKANYGYSGGAQTTWVKNTLASFRADPTIDFIIVYFHYCSFSGSMAQGASALTAQGSDLGTRTTWGPIFDQYNVDLVLSGHIHNYERMDPIKYNATSKTFAASGYAPSGSTINPATSGTTYVVAGGGGQSVFGVQSSTTFMGSTTGTGYDSTASNSVANDSFTNVTYSGPSTSPSSPGNVSSTETVTYSRVRFPNYSYVRFDVAPPTTAGGTTTLKLNAISTVAGGAASGANHYNAGQVIDQLTLQRTSQA